MLSCWLLVWQLLFAWIWMSFNIVHCWIPLIVNLVRFEIAIKLDLNKIVLRGVIDEVNDFSDLQPYIRILPSLSWIGYLFTGTHNVSLLLFQWQPTEDSSWWGWKSQEFEQSWSSLKPGILWCFVLYLGIWGREPLDIENCSDIV